MRENKKKGVGGKQHSDTQTASSSVETCACVCVLSADRKRGTIIIANLYSFIQNHLSNR